MVLLRMTTADYFSRSVTAKNATSVLSPGLVNIGNGVSPFSLQILVGPGYPCLRALGTPAQFWLWLGFRRFCSVEFHFRTFHWLRNADLSILVQPPFMHEPRECMQNIGIEYVLGYDASRLTELWGRDTLHQHSGS